MTMTARIHAARPATAVVGLRPHPYAMHMADRLLSRWWRRTDPVFFGTERIPTEGPLLFVGNHTLMGVLDAPLLWLHLYRERGIVLRSLGDHAHFMIPGWRRMLEHYGAVDGTRENCARLLDAGEPVLVFPGGGREVSKRKGEKYALIWKNRLGFARMAIRHGARIVPFAAVGAEDMLDIVLDADEILASPVGRVVRRLNMRTDIIFPVVKGVGPLPIPRVERLYFEIGDPIETAQYEGLAENDEACGALRDEVRGAVQGGIDRLLAHRERELVRAAS